MYDMGVAMVDCTILIIYTACLGWIPIIFRSLAALLQYTG